MSAEIIQFVPRPNPNRMDLNEANLIAAFEHVVYNVGTISAEHRSEFEDAFADDVIGSFREIKPSACVLILPKPPKGAI